LRRCKATVTEDTQADITGLLTMQGWPAGMRVIVPPALPPTSSSWLNLVERWFAELTNRKLRRSAHRSVTELETDIRKWINDRIRLLTIEEVAHPAVTQSRQRTPVQCRLPAIFSAANRRNKTAVYGKAVRQ
jgi:hypothetical protein